MDTKFILEQFKEKFTGLSIEIEREEEESLTFVAKHCTVGPYDDDVTLRFFFYETAVIVDAIFDQIELTQENYENLNRFNEECVFFTAYASDHSEGHVFLHVRAVVPSIENEKEALHNVFFLMQQLVDEDTIKLLQPLTEATF